MELPPSTQGLALLRQGRYAVTTPSLEYEVDVPDLWRARYGRFLNTPDGSGVPAIFFAAPAPGDATELPDTPASITPRWS